MSFNLQPTLESDLILLRPLKEEDFEALFDVAKDPLIWEQHPNFDRYKPDVFTTLFNESIASNGALVAIEKSNQKIIGSSRYKLVENTDNAVEIGWSYLAREYWGGRYNKHMKRLMLEHAFRHLEHVIFIIGHDNIRSQKACEKIGGVRITESEYPQLVTRVETDFTYLIEKTNWMNEP